MQQPSSASDLKLTMEVVAHLQRIADRSGDKILKETANKAHSAASKGLNEAPGVHLTRITQDQALELVQLAIRTQDHELADFARYCQSVADSSGIGIEPSPGKINEEINKGRQELQQRGPQHTGPGYGAAFASAGSQQGQPGQQQGQQPGQQQAGGAGKAQNLQLTMSQVSHIQRIADRTKDPILLETARRARSAWSRGLSDAPGLHLTWISPEQATELVNLAIKTQDQELADFARYCQSVASTTGVGIEPSPGKIQQELEKGRQELSQSGNVHTGPGYGAAFASASQQQNQGQSQGQQQQGQQNQGQQNQNQQQQAQQQGQQQQGHDWQNQPTNLKLTIDVVAHIQRIADRTGNQQLKETANRAHSACVRGLNEAPGVHLTWITPQQATELVNLAVQTQDRELADFARYCQSVAQTTHVGVEPTPGKIQQEIEKGRQELQQQGRHHTGPGYGAAFASSSNNNQGRGQRAGQTQGQGGQQEQGQQQQGQGQGQQLGQGQLQPGIDQRGGQQQGQEQGKEQQGGQQGQLQPGIDQGQQVQEQQQRGGQGEKQEQGQQIGIPGVLQPGIDQSGGQSQAQGGQQKGGEQSSFNWQADDLKLTMDVVAHIQRIADRTGNDLLKETANRAHSACRRGLTEGPGINLTWITTEQANELVRLAVRTQDRELADFARYCQSVAESSGVGLEPTPGKLQEEITKGMQELQTEGRAHTGPGYGAAFGSQQPQQQQSQQQQQQPQQSM